jgi:hypothetical protein
MQNHPTRDLVPVPPTPHQVVCRDSLTRILLTAASRALRGRDCADIGDEPMLARCGGPDTPQQRHAAVQGANRACVPIASLAEIDTDEVAGWIVDHYLPRPYPAVVVGSPHGAAVHLAAAAGVPWLPAGFEMAVRWPDGSADDPKAALVHGTAVAARLLANNPGLTIRQVHDPVTRRMLAGCTVTLHARWHTLPDPYRQFLSTHLQAGGTVLVVRDMRTWPVLDTGAGHTFQLGSPASGLEPDEYLLGGPLIRQALRYADGDAARWKPPSLSCPDGYVETGVEPNLEESIRAWTTKHGANLHRLLYATPDALSGAVADLYRRWRPQAADRLVVECGRLLDPSQVLRAGLVPYWYESGTSRSATALEWWLAGSTPFTSIEVLVEPSGVPSAAAASYRQWTAIAHSGVSGTVDPGAVGDYTTVPTPTRHATHLLRRRPTSSPSEPLPVRTAVDMIGNMATTSEILLR